MTFRLSLFVSHYALSPFSVVPLSARTIAEARREARRVAAAHHTTFFMVSPVQTP